MSADASYQFRRLKGFCHVIVRTHIERREFIFFAVAHRQYNYCDIRPSADLAAGPEARHIW
jgi:hypothetical protein